MHGSNASLTPQEIVDGLRTGNAFAASGQLIDRLAFVACADTRHQRCHRQPAGAKRRAVERRAEEHRRRLGDNCATMGEKLVVRPGADVVVAIVVRDPSGTNYSPYTFPNPSLAQVGIKQPLNKPVLDHVDVIRGMVTGYKTPGAADYSGQWPSDWITEPGPGQRAGGREEHERARSCARSTAHLDRRSPTTASSRSMIFRIPAREGIAVPAPARHEPAGRRAVRDRCRRQPAGGPVHERRGGATRRIAGRHRRHRPRVPTCGFRARPARADARRHSTDARRTCRSSTVRSTSRFDVAAWSDLWFYSNPIYIEVAGLDAWSPASSKDSRIASCRAPRGNARRLLVSRHFED